MIRRGQLWAEVGRMMTVSETQLRARYAEILDRVAEDHDEVVVTRSDHQSVVLVSLEEYESLKETVHLMRSPANARRLLDAMERLETGAAARHDIMESTSPRRSTHSSTTLSRDDG